MNDYSEHELTQVFEVSRSAYRQHLKQKFRAPKALRTEVIAEMKTINNDPKLKVYGSPRITRELHQRGFSISENTVAKLMREHGIRSKRKYAFKPPKTTVVDKEARYCENVIKEKPPTRFGQQLVADITYIPTKEGWLYLSVVIDLYTRLVVGWETSGAMPATLVSGSLENATMRWKLNTREATFHSDRGCQYTSNLVKKWLKDRGMIQSMSDRGNCYDNASCESFFSSLKAELMPPCGYFQSRKEARNFLFEHIEGFYNTRRLHSSLNYRSPLAFYQVSQKALALAS